MTSVGYDQPAQKALVKLKDIFDMLRDCYRCYWFVDSSNRLRIEHISYFMNGGNYPGDGSPSVGINLTQETVSRNGKAWAFARNQYSFEKPEMTARYQFSWMDDLTQPFNGTPIDIISKYVNPDNIEDINISKFSSDIDYIMLNPSQISKDGFVLLSIGLVSNVPTVMKWTDTLGRVLQNGYASFDFLRRFYYYDLPARNYSVGGVAASALGMKKLKIQTIKFPAYTDPNLLKLITTSIGNGTIQKLSVTLSSRNATATLKYDTE